MSTDKEALLQQTWPGLSPQHSWSSSDIDIAKLRGTLDAKCVLLKSGVCWAVLPWQITSRQTSIFSLLFAAWALHPAWSRSRPCHLVKLPSRYTSANASCPSPNDLCQTLLTHLVAQRVCLSCVLVSQLSIMTEVSDRPRTKQTARKSTHSRVPHYNLAEYEYHEEEDDDDSDYEVSADCRLLQPLQPDLLKISSCMRGAHHCHLSAFACMLVMGTCCMLSHDSRWADDHPGSCYQIMNIMSIWLYQVTYP